MNGKANEYALAVFGLAKDQGRVEEVLRSWKAFVLSLDKDAFSFFLHPSISKQEKRDVVAACVADPLVRDALYVVIDNRRFEWVQTIETELEEIYLRQNQILKLTITSKAPLSQSALANLKTKYEALYQRPVTIETKLDSGILAGLKIAFDGSVEDRTLDRRLADLKQRLKGQ